MQDQAFERALGGFEEQYLDSVHGNEVPRPSELSDPVTQEEFEHSARRAQRFLKELGGEPFDSRLEHFLGDRDSVFNANAGTPKYWGITSTPQTSDVTSGSVSQPLTGRYDTGNQSFLPPFIAELIRRVEQLEVSLGSTSVLDINALASAITQYAPSGEPINKGHKGAGGQKSGGDENRKDQSQSSKRPNLGNGQPSGGSNDPDDNDNDSDDDSNKSNDGKGGLPNKKRKDNQKRGVMCIGNAWDDDKRESFLCQKRFQEVKPLCDHMVADHHFEMVYTKDIKYIAEPIRSGNADDRRSFCLACRLPFDKRVDLEKHNEGHVDAVVDKKKSIILTHAILVDLLVRRRSAAQVTKDFKLQTVGDVAMVEARASAKRTATRGEEAEAAPAIQAAGEQDNLSDITAVTGTTVTDIRSRKRSKSTSMGANASELKGAKKQRKSGSSSKTRVVSSEVASDQQRPLTARMISSGSSTTLQGSENQDVPVDPELEKLFKPIVVNAASSIDHMPTPQNKLTHDGDNSVKPDNISASQVAGDAA